MTNSADNSPAIDAASSAVDATQSLDALATDRVGRSRLFVIVKWLTIALVVGAIAWQVQKLAADWSEDGAKVLEKGLNWSWVAAALGTFWIGQLCFALYWRRLVQVSGADAPFMSTIRAYLVGTLGKYIPGKALVVVVRTGMLPDAKGKRFLVGGATVYETLTSMSAAGLIGFVALLVMRRDLVLNMTGAACIALLLNIVVHPRPFRQIAKVVAIPFRRQGDELPVRHWYRCYLQSAPLLFLEWFGSGLSLWATAAAFGLDVHSVGAVVFLTGVAALATAAGFLVLPVPAGIGVREFIVISLLTHWFGEHATAVCISLILRTIWTVGEIVLAGGLYLLPGVSWARAKLAESNGAAASS